METTINRMTWLLAWLKITKSLDDERFVQAGMKKMEYKSRQWHEKCFVCCTCNNPIGTKSFIPKVINVFVFVFVFVREMLCMLHLQQPNRDKELHSKGNKWLTVYLSRKLPRMISQCPESQVQITRSRSVSTYFCL